MRLIISYDTHNVNPRIIIILFEVDLVVWFDGVPTRYQIWGLHYFCKMPFGYNTNSIKKSIPLFIQLDCVWDTQYLFTQLLVIQ